MRFLLGLTLAVAVSATAQQGNSPSTLRRADLGHTVKFTCVVDKVMQAHAGWVAEEWMIREAAEAGFNIYSPRIGYEDLDAVARVTAWCRRHLPPALDAGHPGRESRRPPRRGEARGVGQRFRAALVEPQFR